MFAFEIAPDWRHWLARYVFIGGLIAVAALSLVPVEKMPGVGLSDKLGHFLAYAALGLTGALGYAGRWRPLAVVLAIVALGLVLECLQLFVPGRTFSGLDIVANIIGTALGAIMSGVVGVLSDSRN